MRDIHPIRLRGPWQYEPVARQAADSPAELPPAGRVKMPCDWRAALGDDFTGQARFTRHFGCPTAVEPHETIWLIVEAIDASAQVRLNEALLGELKPNEPASFNVTGKLNQRNELVLDVTALRPPAGLIGEVRLEIHGVEYGG